MRRFDFDTLLAALNAADVHRLSFIREVLPEASRRGMGLIGMKVYSQGHLLGEGGLSAADAMGYVLSLQGVSTVIIGCQTPAEVEDNVRIVRQFVPFERSRMLGLEARTLSNAEKFTYLPMQLILVFRKTLANSHNENREMLGYKSDLHRQMV